MVDISWPLSYVVASIAMYSIFRRAEKKADMLLDSRFVPIRSRRALHEGVDEVVTVLAYRKDREGLDLVKAGFFIFIAFVFLLFVAAGFNRNLAQMAADGKLLLLVFFNLLGAALPWVAIMHDYGHIRVITKRGVLHHSPFRRDFFAGWSQIRSVRWLSGPYGAAFLIQTEEGPITVDPGYRNIGEFARAVMANVPESKWTEVKERLRAMVETPSLQPKS